MEKGENKQITALDIIVGGTKYFIVCVIALIIVALIAKPIIYHIKKVMPLTNENEYAVYSGRNVYEYYRSILSKKQQVIYDDMKEGYLQFKPSFHIKSLILKKSELKEVYRAIKLDHPEMFWAESYNDNISHEGFINTFDDIDLTYAYTKEESKAIKKRIEPKYQKIIDGAKSQSNDHAKIKYVHDELVKMSEYDNTNADNHEYQSIISIFDTGKAICTTYAYSFKFIMDQLGIEAVSSRNITDKEDSSKNHVWNVVNLYGEWLNLDITGDVGYTKNGKVAYNYFLKKNEDFYIDETHLMQPDMPKN